MLSSLKHAQNHKTWKFTETAAFWLRNSLLVGEREFTLMEPTGISSLVIAAQPLEHFLLQHVFCYLESQFSLPATSNEYKNQSGFFCVFFFFFISHLLFSLYYFQQQRFAMALINFTDSVEKGPTLLATSFLIKVASINSQIGEHITRKSDLATSCKTQQQWMM